MLEKSKNKSHGANHLRQVSFCKVVHVCFGSLAKHLLRKLFFCRWSFLGLVLDVGLVSKPGLPSATPTRGHSRGRLQDRIFKFSQGRPSHLLSSLFKGCNQKAEVHQARASILKSRLDFAPVCIRQVRNPGLDFFEAERRDGGEPLNLVAAAGMRQG